MCIGRSKCPEASFIQRTLQIPSAKAQPSRVKTRHVGLTFPILLFEVAHNLESRQRLIRDGPEKVFSLSISRCEIV
jgi:hypothetical protein